MSHDGREFTYVNQLASSDTDPSQREKWFTCACCPPNMLRLFGSLAGYVTSTSFQANGSHLAVHLYVPSTTLIDVEGQVVRVKQTSNWPWEGDIKFEVLDPRPGLSIKLRIPSWAPEHHVRLRKKTIAVLVDTNVRNRSFQLVPRLVSKRGTCIFLHLGYLRILDSRYQSH